jgi:hypothetical protein
MRYGANNCAVLLSAVLASIDPVRSFFPTSCEFKFEILIQDASSKAVVDHSFIKIIFS